MTSAPTSPRCAHCGHDGTYDRETGQGGALYLTVDCMWKADVGKWELMERDDESGRSFDCLKCDARTAVNGAEEACFPYGALIAPAGHPAAEAGTVFHWLSDGLEASTDGRGWDANHERARLLAEASPQMLALLETMLDVCDMADPKHENFADSAADCLQVILENEQAMRAIVAKARGKA